MLCLMAVHHTPQMDISLIYSMVMEEIIRGKNEERNEIIRHTVEISYLKKDQ